MRPNTQSSASNPTPDGDGLGFNRRRLIGTIALLLAVLVAAWVLWMTASVPMRVDAQADYYNDTNTTGAADGWFGDGEPTLDQIVGMVTRVPDYVIGTGQQDPSGTGYQGMLLTGLIMIGASVSAVAGLGVGPVGGAAVGLTVGFGLARIGLAPPWVRVIMLFGLGILAAAAIRRGQGGR